ncbi:hypothetical protein [Vibrio campbellii]|uniref:hypothetical protein n=1 Tax=Vibrio campbellii TaxID=680 RepID=UPI001F3A70B9|nr:hypothetical protein [Vibrio campbellii]MCE7730150.1 hypothetical protein [Vibrio campbellii]
MNYKHYLDAHEHIGTFYNKHYLNQWVAEFNDFFSSGNLSQEFIDAMRVLKDDIYSSISKEYWPYITERFLSTALNDSGKYCHDAIVVFVVVSVEANFSGVDKSYSAQQKVKALHGGARKGAGRKKEAPTKQIRIDADLAEQFKMLSDLYRAQPDSDKALLFIKSQFQHIKTHF